MARLPEQRRTSNGVEHTPETLEARKARLEKRDTARAEHAACYGEGTIDIGALVTHFNSGYGSGYSAGLDAGRASMVETVTTEQEGKQLPNGCAVIDANGDVFETYQRGVWMTDVKGTYSWNFVKMPARVLFRPDREEQQ